MSTIKRWDRLQRKYVDVSCPAIVEEYDEHMGGGDLFDMLMSLYRLARSQKLQVVLPKFLLGCCCQWVAIVLPSHTAGPRSFGFHSNYISEILISEYKLDPILVREYHGRRHGQVMWKTQLPRELNLLLIQN